MIRTISDFTGLWTYERQSTQAMLDLLTDPSLAQQEAEGHRTLGRMAWHIVSTIPEMMERTGLAVPGVDPHAPPPGSARAIADAYREVSASLAQEVAVRWTDETLLETDDMYGERWARGSTLLSLILHQTHHRGQVTVLMRQAGLPVPGVYGPSRDEWARMGAPAPEV